MISPIARLCSTRAPLTPAAQRAAFAEAFHVKRIAVLPIADIKDPDDRAVVERLCEREYGRRKG